METIDVPPSWSHLPLDELRGTLLVVGATDVGKTTLARYLFQTLRAQGCKVWFLDGDPGQSALGPPTTLTLSSELDVGVKFLSDQDLWRYFVGSTSPTGHMLPVLVGGARLVQAAYAAGAEAVVYDTSGLIDPRQGGLALKSAKIDLLRPQAILAIQRDQELEPLLSALRRSQRTRVMDLHPSEAVLRRDSILRREYRAQQFARYFSKAKLLVVDWTRLAIFPLPWFRINRLVALEDVQGFTQGLGIVRQIDRLARQVTLSTPMASLQNVNALRLGDIFVDPETFQDEKISKVV
jgi:polynucleotide 5'-hydroxyl-kinase GRC3/NOL9